MVMEFDLEPVDLPATLSEEYVLIPPGTFTMGCVPGDNACNDGEKPRHEVTIAKGFGMGHTEVTVGAYRRFVTAVKGEMPEPPSYNPGWKDEDHPIVNVGWRDAQYYCRSVGGRLPTEAEWEYAARGGKDCQIYPNGNQLTEKDAHFGTGGTSTVGAFPSNGYGLYDMAGNVWEWVHDWYKEDYYSSSPAQRAAGARRRHQLSPARRLLDQ